MGRLTPEKALERLREDRLSWDEEEADEYCEAVEMAVEALEALITIRSELENYQGCGFIKDGCDYAVHIIDKYWKGVSK